MKSRTNDYYLSKMLVTAGSCHSECCISFNSFNDESYYLHIRPNNLLVNKKIRINTPLRFTFFRSDIKHVSFSTTG